MLLGVARLPEGVRKQQLALSVSAMLEQDFAGQILSFDLSAASVYAMMLAERERSGQPMAMALRCKTCGMVRLAMAPRVRGNATGGG